MIQRDKIVYFLLVFSIFWSFLGNYVLNELGIESAAVLINYGIYGATYLWFLNKLLLQPNKFNSKKEKDIFFRMGKLVLAYLLLTLFISFIHGERTDFSHFRRNYGVVIPSVFVPFLLAVLSRKLIKNYKTVVWALYLIMFATIIASEFMSSFDTGTINSDDYREGGIFDQANNYGYFLALFQVLTISNMTGFIELHKSRIVSVAVMGVTFFLILKTGSYGSLIVAILGGVYLAYNELKKIRPIQVIGFVFVVFALYQGFTQYSSSEGTSKRVSALRDLLVSGKDESIQSQSTFNKRYALVVEGIPVFLENFLIGRGMVGGKDIEVEGESIAVHNVFVAAALKGGVAYLYTVILMYLFLYKLIKRIRIRRFRKLGFALLFYLVFMDNTLTAASFLTFNAGSIVLTLVFLLVFNDELIRYRQLQQKEARKAELELNPVMIEPA